MNAYLVVIEMESKHKVSITVDIFFVILNFLNISDPFMGLGSVLLLVMIFQTLHSNHYWKTN